VLFFGLGLATLDDYGITWDEEASYTAGVQNLAIVRAVLSGQEPPPWFGHEILGYQFVFDSLRALFATRVGPLFFEPESVLAFHLFNLILSSGSLWLLHRLILELGGSGRMAALAALALAALPRFLAHSQNNPKDVIGLFCFEAALLLVVRGASRPLRSSVPAGLGLGLALASHVVSVLVVPIAAFWLLVHGEGPWRRKCLRLAALCTIAPPAALICWPWFWRDTLARVQETLAHLSTFQPDVPVLYLGTVYPYANPPWHYSPVLLAVSTPVLLWIAAAIGACQLRAGARGRRVAQLALVWIGVMAAADLLAPSHYDGVRHLLPIFAPIAALAGLGADRVWERTLRAPLGLGLAAAVTLSVLDLVRMHPYHNSYLNEIARIIWAEQPERSFGLHTWGAAYKEGAEWLLQNAEPSAAVVVPIGPQCARPYLEGRMLFYVSPPRDMPYRPTYLMFVTRVAAYGPLISYVQQNLEPVFSVGRGGATYLEIYRLPPELLGR
jgi:4-amino-4-deoxy-L-arabinose transferase-like glycosyltransferase